jgi:hypothetical protein
MPVPVPVTARTERIGGLPRLTGVRCAAMMLGLFCLESASPAQQARVQRVAPIDMPAQVDSNSPAYWLEGALHLFNSTWVGLMRSDGADLSQLGIPVNVPMSRVHPWPAWIESVWVDPNGTVFAWYHQEHQGVCPGARLAVPHIGAAISHDGGKSFHDLGAVISSGDPRDCQSQNGYFAGGQGDFSVIPDRNREFFYFLFTNYDGPAASQGVAIARMPFANRYNPLGAVWKYHAGAWTEPGVHGRVTPIFPARVRWQRPDTDSFWGPSVHWNTYLDSYVMLLSHSCCSPGFPQEGIYASFAGDLSDPSSWTRPRKILQDPDWYPQILGTATGATDTLAGRNPRLYIAGHSRWEIVFEKSASAVTTPRP